MRIELLPQSYFFDFDFFFCFGLAALAVVFVDFLAAFFGAFFGAFFTALPRFPGLFLCSFFTAATVAAECLVPVLPELWCGTCTNNWTAHEKNALLQNTKSEVDEIV